MAWNTGKVQSFCNLWIRKLRINLLLKRLKISSSWEKFSMLLPLTGCLYPIIESRHIAVTIPVIVTQGPQALLREPKSTSKLHSWGQILLQRSGWIHSLTQGQNSNLLADSTCSNGVIINVIQTACLLFFVLLKCEKPTWPCHLLYDHHDDAGWKRNWQQPAILTLLSLVPHHLLTVDADSYALKRLLPSAGWPTNCLSTLIPQEYRWDELFRIWLSSGLYIYIYIYISLYIAGYTYTFLKDL